MLDFQLTKLQNNKFSLLNAILVVTNHTSNRKLIQEKTSVPTQLVEVCDSRKMSKYIVCWMVISAEYKNKSEKYQEGIQF